MKIYKVTRSGPFDYQDCMGFICIAPDMATAKRLMPPYDDDIDNPRYNNPLTWDQRNLDHAMEIWAGSLDEIKVELLGIADATFDKTKILLASFNAG